eukprot:6492070-Amphidinium_carterae.2
MAIAKGGAVCQDGDSNVHQIMLQAHLDRFKEAQQLLPEAIVKLSQETREQYIQSVIDAGLPIPPFTRGGILAAVVKSMTLTDRIRALDPHASQQAPNFDPKSPTLASCELPDGQNAKLVQRLAISEGIIPVIWTGQQGHAVLMRAVAHITAHWSHMLDSTPPLAKCAVKDCLQVAAGLQNIFGDGTQSSMESKLAGEMLLDTKTKTGMLFICKQACHLGVSCLGIGNVAVSYRAFRKKVTLSETLAVTPNIANVDERASHLKATSPTDLNSPGCGSRGVNREERCLSCISVSEALLQTPFYKAKVAEHQRTQTAMMTHADRIQEALQQMEKEHPEAGEIEHCLRQLPGWCESLRSSLVQKLVETTESATKKYVARVQAAQTKFGEQSAETRTAQVQELSALAKSINETAAALGQKFPSLVIASNSVRDLLGEVNTVEKQLHLVAGIRLVEALDFEKGTPEDDIVKLTKMLGREGIDSTPLTEELGFSMEKAVETICQTLVATAAKKITEQTLSKSLTPLLSVARTFASVLGSAGRGGADHIRHKMMAAVDPLMCLEQIVQAKPAVDIATDLAKGNSHLGHVIHAISLWQRLEAFGKEKVSGDFRRTFQVSVRDSARKASTYITDIGKEIIKIEAEQLELLQSKILKYTYKDNATKNIWSLHLKENCTLEELKAEASKTLMKQSYAGTIQQLLEETTKAQRDPDIP